MTKAIECLVDWFSATIALVVALDLRSFNSHQVLRLLSLLLPCCCAYDTSTQAQAEFVVPSLPKVNLAKHYFRLSFVFQSHPISDSDPVKLSRNLKL